MDRQIPSSSKVPQSNRASSQDPRFSDTKSVSTTHPETKSKTAKEITNIKQYVASASPVSNPNTAGPNYSPIAGPAKLKTDFYGSYSGTPPPDHLAALKSNQRRPHPPDHLAALKSNQRRPHPPDHLAALKSNQRRPDPRNQDPSRSRSEDQAQEDGDSSPRQTSYPALDDEHATIEDFGFLPTITPAIKKRLAGGWTGFEEVKEMDDGIDFSKPEVGGRRHEAVARTRPPKGN
ncbi:uncharacterized protein L3040_003193 [Drepanopeziza brunnea f. sp. 'multigermtubi']|uniref:Uncharacterized protein n=1 Tax=Marssonina brunnea f. sp. multigermtubi (strain MB_m1) TaxID=1072389 RepID=K1XTN9_MARBU|nr:uncharacterized protein MBM_05960 [Drepanopeziza brunnea f. sp. 'multigermtubi' MB_m1]EKD15949.1 hypothetical protein MBM_05960 [Drepanopeziza brunnea f. sp. 'multigermtubi' MB_m1]KAJ5047366.1 hypothetical protein L3040_003193 [Drepanopeziza brunnea f. sp. 'multigermtubi']